MAEMNADSQFTIDTTGKKKVILSVDGGGMRGAIPIAMLAELEAQTGKTCQQLFDMVAGTSTGAIIAVGLAVGLSAQEMLEKVYLDLLPEAFRATKPGFIPRVIAGLLRVVGVIGKKDAAFFARLLSHRGRYAYPMEPFRTALQPFVGHKRVHELSPSDSPILLVTTKDVFTSSTYFIVSAGKGKDMFREWPLAGVVASSGAAPVFFPPIMYRLVDGGVGVHSNPCLAASVEAMEYISPEMPEFRAGNVVHVSLGTGYIENRVALERARKYWALDWLRYVVSESLDDAALQQVFATRAIYGKILGVPGRMDFRRYNPLLTAENVAENLGISLDGRPDPGKLGLDSHEPKKVELMVQIGREYARRLDWSAPDLMPWETVGGHPAPGDIQHEPVSWEGTPYFGQSLR